MKKKVVFFMTTMHIGGIEKALIELLNNRKMSNLRNGK